MGCCLAADDLGRLERDLADDPRCREGLPDRDLRGGDGPPADDPLDYPRGLPAGDYDPAAGLVPYVEETGEAVDPGRNRANSQLVAQLRREAATVVAEDLVIFGRPVFAHLIQHRHETGLVAFRLPEVNAAVVLVASRCAWERRADAVATVGPLAAEDLNTDMEGAAHGHSLGGEGQDFVGFLQTLVEVVDVQEHRAGAGLDVV
mmetsp:Transcript_107825/g.304850  ORF Transcript_107825/g.304850 Transcript_107825/m.304850 type:complete len:204 (-) Transcript_107825:309-920(-)